MRRQIVSYPGNEPAGTIIIDTAHTFLYLTLGGGEALRYGIGVGREGFTWTGVEKISRKTEWPDWIPPAEMIARQPYLPRWVGGGPGNPLGARALYLGNTAYRIHGTNNPNSIGKHVSSGCIRLRDADVIDLYGRVGIGTKVIVLPNDQRQALRDQAWSDQNSARRRARRRHQHGPQRRDDGADLRDAGFGRACSAAREYDRHADLVRPLLTRHRTLRNARVKPDVGGTFLEFVEIHGLDPDAGEAEL